MTLVSMLARNTPCRPPPRAEDGWFSAWPAMTLEHIRANVDAVASGFALGVLLLVAGEAIMAASFKALAPPQAVADITADDIAYENAVIGAKDGATVVVIDQHITAAKDVADVNAVPRSTCDNPGVGRVCA